MAVLHAHVQIQYDKNEDPNQCIETLEGIDPRNSNDRKLAHDMLDEYLDVIGKFMTKIQCEHNNNFNVNESFNQAQNDFNPDDPDNGFHVYSYVDYH